MASHDNNCLRVSGGSQAKPSQARPGQAKPGQAKPGQAGGNRGYPGDLSLDLSFLSLDLSFLSLDLSFLSPGWPGEVFGAKMGVGKTRCCLEIVSK